MRKTLPELLNEVDEFLAEGTDESRYLWSILSALRGPDDFEPGPGRVLLKNQTTVHVRMRAFPKTAQAYASGFLLIGATFATAEPFTRARRTLSHFIYHIDDAIDALRAIGR